MCYFITLVVPNYVKYEHVAAVLNKYNRKAEIINNNHINSQLNGNEVYLYPDISICDCGSLLGSLNFSRPSENRVSLGEIKKLENKGWSKSKIGRWLEEKKKYNERQKRIYEDNVTVCSSETDPDNWISISNELCSFTKEAYVGILLHFYNDSIDKEMLEIKNRVNISLNDNASVKLLNMNVDELMIIRK